jgi:hypothetical protein
MDISREELGKLIIKADAAGNEDDVKTLLKAYNSKDANSPTLNDKIDSPTLDSDEPTLGQVVGGVGTEAAVGIGGQAAGAAIGTAIFPGVGTAIGYGVGSIGSGIAGSIAAQKIEGRDDISWGRAIAAGLINLTPGGSGKIAKGSVQIGKVAAKEAAKGSLIGATEVTSKAIVDEGRLPTPEELAQYGGVGAMFGGVTGPVVNKVASKLAGKTAKEIDEAVATGEIDYNDLEFVLKQGQEKKLPSPLPETRGQGVQYHGTTGDISKLSSDTYSSLNIYGQGLYTTDAIDIAKGYSNKGSGETSSIYKLKEIKPVKFLDLESISADDFIEMTKVKNLDEVIDAREFIGPKANARELYDSIRHNTDLSADEIQEFIFSEIQRNLERQGIGGIRHLGGLKTGNKPHNVKIYFDPKNQLVSEKYMDIAVDELTQLKRKQKRLQEERRNLPYGDRNAFLDWQKRYQENQNSIIRSRRPKPSMEGFLRMEIQKTKERVLSQEAATVLSQPNKLKVPTSMKRVFASVAPSKVAGRGAQEESIAYRNKINAAESEASRIEQRVNKFIEFNPSAISKVNDFLEGADLDSSLEKIAPELNRYRETLDELQSELTQQLDDGQMQHLGAESRKVLSDTIRESQKEKNYVTRDYEIFTNKNFKQDAKKRLLAEKELRNYYINQGQSIEKAHESAKKHLDYLVRRSARSMADKPNGTGAAHLEGILRTRRQPGPAERAFLGEIKDTGAKMRGTLTRTARLVARNAADKNIANNLESVGLASRVQGEGMEALNLRSQDNTELFVNSEVQIAINKLYADNFIDQTGDIIQDTAKDLVSTGIGLSKATMVLGNVPSYAVQFYGAAASLASAGVNIFKPAQMSRGLRLALSDFGIVRDLTTNPKSKKKLLDDMRTMEKYGLKGSSIIESDFRATFDKGFFSNLAGKVINPFGKLYSSTDTMGRYVGWKAQQETIKKLFPDLNKDQVERIGALVINDVYPNYDKLSGTVRWATKWGFMEQFASFTAEFMRNQYNQGRIINQMMRGTFGQEFGLRVSPERVKLMQAEGRRRFAALAATYGAAYGIAEGIKSQFGVTPDKEAALKETVIASWDKNKQLAIALSKGGTTGSYANMSYIFPQSVGISAFQAGFDGQDITSLSGLLVDELVGEGTFVNKAAMQALDNRNERGKQISYSESDYTQFKERLSYYITQTLKPGTAREVEKAMKAQRGVGDHTMKEIAARQVGVRLNKFDIAEQAMYNIKSTNENATLAKNEYNSTRNYKDVSPQELERIYNKTNESRKQSWQKMVRHYQNLATLGKDEDQRIRIFKDAGVSGSDILSIIDREYIDIPRQKTLSTEEIYEGLDGDTSKQKVSSIRAISKENPELGKKLLSQHKKALKISMSSLSERDKLISNMSVEKRVDYLIKIGAHENRALLKEQQRKGIATEKVIRLIQSKSY